MSNSSKRSTRRSAEPSPRSIRLVYGFVMTTHDAIRGRSSRQAFAEEFIRCIPNPVYRLKRQQCEAISRCKVEAGKQVASAGFLSKFLVGGGK